MYLSVFFLCEMKKMKKKRIMLAILPRFPTKWTTVSKKDLMIRESYG